MTSHFCRVWQVPVKDPAASPRVREHSVVNLSDVKNNHEVSGRHFPARHLCVSTLVCGPQRPVAFDDESASDADDIVHASLLNPQYPEWNHARETRPIVPSEQNTTRTSCSDASRTTNLADVPITSHIAESKTVDDDSDDSRHTAANVVSLVVDHNEPTGGLTTTTKTYHRDSRLCTVCKAGGQRVML